MEGDELENKVKIIMRQTDYTREQAVEKLNEHQTVEKCIENYLGISKKVEDKPVSTNQAIYKSIREWMK